MFGIGGAILNRRMAKVKALSRLITGAYIAVNRS